MVFQNDILAGAAGAGGGYTIDQSIRFNDDDTAYLTRTPSSNGDRRTFTWSGWVKLGDGAIDSKAYLLATTGSASDSGYFTFYIATDNSLYVTGYSTVWLRTSQLFRDPSAWYHIVIRVDSTNATADDRIRIYVNGEQVTSFQTSSNPSLNHDFGINTTSNTTYLFSESPQGGGPTSDKCWDGYGAEINFIDGQSLGPTNFGETNADTGQWVPVKYTGSYGTNGFYLKGQDSSNLGDDSSGNNNDFTSSGLTAADQVSDSPTDNYAVFNNIIKGENSYHAGGYGWGSNTISEGGLKVLGPTGTNLAGATISYPSSGKFYYEATYIGTDTAFFGIADLYDDTKAVWYRNNGWVSENSSSWNTSSGAASYSAGDVLAIAVNMDGNEAKFYKNNSLQSTVSLTAGSTYTPVLFGGNSSIGFSIDFGQLGFTYTPPTGFTALSTANLPDPTIADGSEYFHPQLYTGTGSSGLAITNEASAGDFKPDILWLSPRSNGDNKVFFDSVRGTTQRLKSNSTDAEDTDATAQITFETNGFDLDTTDPNFNGSGNTYVAWQWHTTGGTSGSNTDGSVSSTVSANTTAGISIASWTHTTASNYTVGHGLGAVPKMVIVKTRDQATNWGVYHSDITVGNRLILNSTSAQIAGFWGANSWTTSTFSIGSARDANGSTMIGYSFAEVEGFSKFGSYTGNGSTDGPFIYTGFKPRWVMIKRYTSTESWPILDTARGSGNFGSAAGTGGTDPTAGNDLNAVLVANNTAAEEDNPAGSRRASYVSNGFKVRTTNTAMNASGSGYIYMAFAECPFKTATAR